jgi:glutamine synthetase
MMTFLEYIWIGGHNEIRSKTKILNGLCSAPDLIVLPNWNYDGSSTDQAPGNNSEIIIKPCRIYKNPFHNNLNSYLVLCDTYINTKDGEEIPHVTNTRYKAEKIFKDNDFENDVPLFGIEHEFFVHDLNTGKPLGFPNSQLLPLPQGPYYCGVGAGKAYGRDFLDELLQLCVKADIKVTGSNLEVAPGQMEIQICASDLQAGDDSIIFKYIANRLGEKYNYIIDFSCKPIEGDWNGSGCHVNFSTKEMMEAENYDVILDILKKLEKNHKEHIKIYGNDNFKRLTGNHETSTMDNFSYGVANRGASIRIPNETFKNKKGYLEDRRPGASADMYLVTSKIFETIKNN